MHVSGKGILEEAALARLPLAADVVRVISAVCAWSSRALRRDPSADRARAIWMK
jgi:hypothetical protein